ncbi:hypothetical protein BUALT_Bualt01G0073000 [Buddleja alternifolia]|uniref:Scarecrow-like protein 8 n=1 Tax=Buddleja alternifolia TaxID=168488 RepID=A0AAV6Y571_9LAMI|nr:hypothetical protein BUALT_Bualt01G0073000 [Buddleja alternifolia]
MSSGFSGGRSTAMNNTYNTYNLNPQQRFSFRSPLSGALPDPAAQIRRPDLTGKRSLSEFQNNQHGPGLYLRNVKPRPNYQHASPISPLSPVDFSPVPSISQDISSVSTASGCVNLRYGVPILRQHRTQPLNFSNRDINNVSNCTSLPNLVAMESEKKTMSHRLQELEKELLGDGDDEEEEDVSVVTNNEWSDTIQNLIDPIRSSNSRDEQVIMPETVRILKRTDLSPTSSSSSSSSCCSTSASPPISCPKQSLIESAAAISDGKFDAAAEILTRLQQVANPRGSSEQRLTSYMVSALKSRVSPTQRPMAASELYSKEHTVSTQMLYEVSPCFKLGFMAANLAIIDATSKLGFQKIHVVDFDIGQGGQYVHLLHALSANKSDAVLKITTFTDFVSGGEEKLKMVEKWLKSLANRIGVSLIFCIKSTNFTDLSREKLGVESDEALAVNFAFKLHKLPDESVTTENLRDELLRRVKSLSPAVMTVVEQDMNANTAPLATRVREACEHYGALFDALEATVSRENPDRVRIEEAMGRKMGNSVACEGRDRVERCEVFGKWRARMSMAGFRALPMGQPVADSLRSKLNSGTRGNPGFTVNEQSGGICCGWMGRTLTVASAWR